MSVGTSVPRVEDERLLTGRGRFVADVVVPGMVEAAFVRSPLAHARIVSVDVERARTMPGVLAVFTADDLDPATQPHGFAAVPPDFLATTYRTLAREKVRHVGDPVAVVIAESRATAEDARDAVEVEYDWLEPVVSVADALDAAKPPVFDELGSNVARRAVKTWGDPDAGFAAADRVVRTTVVTPRISAAPIETRGGIAELDPTTGVLSYTVASRNPHAMRAGLSALLGRPLEQVVVSVPDVGGAFGQKNYASREDVCVCFAAGKLGRPVRWIEDRAENLVGYAHGRGEEFEVAVAVRDDGTILALDVKAAFDQGAYGVAFPIAAISAATSIILPNGYRIDHIRWEEVDVVTNKASFSSVRGPWANETLLRETALDAVARELGLDPLEIRRRNLVPLDEQPRAMAGGTTLEGSSIVRTLERAVELLGYDDLRAQQRSAAAGPKRIGIGIATFIEPTPGPKDYGTAMGFQFPDEEAVVELDADGTLVIYTSQTPHGQGHATTLAQIGARELGVPVERVRLVAGDTSTTPVSMIGTGGSRASSMAAGAVVYAVRALREKIVALSGEAQPGIDAIERVAAQGDRLRTPASFRSGPGGWSGGTHACVVEVDTETGIVEIVRYVVVDDCGAIINPAIVAGQVRGGVAMGVGFALLEDAGYDEDGNPSSTLMDYLLPTAVEVPAIELEHVESELLHELDYRGVGEGGTIAAPPALVNAIADAVGGIDAVRLPLTPERVLELADRA